MPTKGVLPRDKPKGVVWRRVKQDIRRQEGLRIAVCCSGFMKQCFAPAMWVLREVLEADVFVATWDRMHLHQPKNSVTEETLKDYDFKRLLIEPFDPIYEEFAEREKNLGVKYGTGWKRRKGKDSYCMWSMVKKANDLKKQVEMEEGFTYDVVIRSRFDYEIRQITIPEVLDPKLVYMPNWGHHCDGYCDIIGFGTSATMDIYSSLYDHMDEYIVKERIKWINELLMMRHLRKNGLERLKTLIHVHPRPETSKDDPPPKVWEAGQII